MSRPTPNQAGVIAARQRREQIVEVVEKFRDERGFSPTRPEIAAITGLALKTVEVHVRTLIREGILIENGVRTLRLPTLEEGDSQ